MSPSPEVLQMAPTVAVVAGAKGVVASLSCSRSHATIRSLSPRKSERSSSLELLVASDLTIYITRSRSWFWGRPWPNWRLFWTTEATQVLGTLAAVYGWLLEPIGWEYALLVWAYVLLWFPVNNAARVWVLRLWERGLIGHKHHLDRAHASLHISECPPASCACPPPRKKPA